MATLPTPGGDVNTWGEELNEYLIETREIAEDATNVAAAASQLAQLVAATPDSVLAAAQAAVAAASSHEDDALAAATAAGEYAALAQSIADGIDTAVLPPGGTNGQVLERDDAVPVYGASWQDPTGLVLSVNGDTGDVVLTAEDVGALADTYVAPVTSVNGETGAVSLSAADVGALTSVTVEAIITANTAVAANTAARHTHSNSSILSATTASFTTALNTKLSGIEALADVTDAANVDAAGAVMNTDTSTAAMSFVIDEDDLASNSATKVPTQQSVRAYIDGAIDTVPNANDVTVRVVWTGTAWPALPVHSTPMELWSTNDADATVPDDANLIEGDVWKRHPAAV